MENYRISLKNVYRLLTVHDYPMYSNNVLSENNRKGLTLMRFWINMLPYNWRNTRHGKIIWRVEGSKNRLHSELCNRKAEFLYYEEYIDEILRDLKAEDILEQTKRFQDFLLQKEYDPAIFRRKLEVFLEKAGEQDPCFTSQAYSFFRQSAVNCRENKIEASFADAWFLTLLTIHGIAGEAMNTASMQELRSKEIMPVHLLSSIAPDAGSFENVLLTNKNSALWQPSLPIENFFGRETELYDLEEMVKAGGHFLVSGIGGMGKTELLRQHLQQILSKPMRLRIATVQYEGGLSSSFNLSFPRLMGTSAQECLNECAYLLSEKEHTVLYIDNLDVNRLTKEEKEFLRSLPCTVFASTRQHKLDGFQTYKLSALDLKASALVFRSNYRHALGKKEREFLEHVFSSVLLQHPLTLQMLGRTAHARKWTISDFHAQIENNIWDIRGKSNVEAGLRNIYKTLYRDSNLTEREQKVTRLFAILPYQTYSVEDIQLNLGLDESEQDLSVFEHMRDLGWLEQHEENYSMHPVIAECILFNHRPTEKEFQPLWARGREVFDRFLYKKESGELFLKNINIDQEYVDIATLIFFAAERIHGKITDAFIYMCEIACYILIGRRFSAPHINVLLEKLVQQADNLSDITEILLTLIKVGMQYVGDPTFVKALLDKYSKRDEAIPAWMYYELYCGFITDCVLHAQFEEAQSMITDGLAWEIEPPLQISVRATLLLYCGLLHRSRLNLKEAADYFLKVVELTDDQDSNFLDVIVMANFYLAWCYAQMRDAEKAQKAYHAARIRMTGEVRTDVLIICEDTLAVISELAGDWKAAIQARLESRRQAQMYGGKDSLHYIDTTRELATLYVRANQPGKAHGLYDEVITYYRNHAREVEYRMVFALNNAGVAYLDDGDPELAYPLLLEAAEIARKIGEVPLAEVTFNLSRVWRSRKNTKKELACLEACTPIFERGYGPEHPKTVKAKTRLAQLQAK